MGNKKLILGTAAVIIAVAIIIIAEKMSAVKPPEHKTLLFPGLDEKRITAIEITDSPQEVAFLVKRDGAWEVSASPPTSGKEGAAGGVDKIISADSAVNNVNSVDSDDSGNANAEAAADPEFFPADSASIHVAIEKLLSMKTSDLASNNPANQTAFGVDTASARKVKIFTDGKRDAPSHVLLIGKNGPSWNSNYVRVLGTDAVYLISGGIRFALFSDAEQWKKKVPEEPEVSEILDEEITTIED